MRHTAIRDPKILGVSGQPGIELSREQWRWPDTKECSGKNNFRCRSTKRHWTHRKFTKGHEVLWWFDCVNGPNSSPQPVFMLFARRLQFSPQRWCLLPHPLSLYWLRDLHCPIKWGRNDNGEKVLKHIATHSSTHADVKIKQKSGRSPAHQQKDVSLQLNWRNSWWMM